MVKLKGYRAGTLAPRGGEGATGPLTEKRQTGQKPARLSNSRDEFRGGMRVISFQEEGEKKDERNTRGIRKREGKKRRASMKGLKGNNPHPT